LILFHAPCSVLVARGGVRLAPPTVERREDREDREERELVSPFG